MGEQRGCRLAVLLLPRTLAREREAEMTLSERPGIRQASERMTSHERGSRQDFLVGPKR
jgi:hypothetical protein